MATIRMSPTVSAFPDEKHENLTIEVELPGVTKDEITFKLHDDSFYIDAKKEGVEYKGSFAICCPVKPGHAKAVYENGLLKVTVPYKDPLEDVVEVPIE